jgi:hypothetical protein
MEHEVRPIAHSLGCAEGEERLLSVFFPRPVACLIFFICDLLCKAGEERLFPAMHVWKYIKMYTKNPTKCIKHMQNT